MFSAFVYLRSFGAASVRVGVVSSKQTVSLGCVVAVGGNDCIVGLL